LLATAFLYIADNIEQAVLALKAQGVVFCALPFLMYMFLSTYTSNQRINIPWTLGLALFFVICLIENLLSPFSIRFMSIDTVADLTLPWGEVLHTYGGKMGILFRLFTLVGMGIGVWGIYRGWLIARREKRREGYWLAAVLCLMLGTAVWGRLIDFGVVNSFYTLGFGFLSVVLFVSFDLANQMRVQHHALNIAAVSFNTRKATVITDADINIIQVNQAFEMVTGYTAQEAIGQKITFIGKNVLSTEESQENDENIQRSLAKTGTWIGEVTARRKSGEIYPIEMTVNSVINEKNVTSHYVTSFKDISQQKNAEFYIRQLEQTDSLTGLVNRKLLKEKMLVTQKESAAANRYGAILTIDIDNFGKFKRELGNKFADMLVGGMSNRLKKFAGKNDAVARIDGDEFVLFFGASVENRKIASRQFYQIAENIRQALSAPYVLFESEYKLTVSVVVGLYCGTKKSPEEMMASAQKSMSRAKVEGGNRVIYYR
jgi:diguanylate cyclase (GGDEF)-like protein/PAS domain S-box-containing protein